MMPVEADRKQNFRRRPDSSLQLFGVDVAGFSHFGNAGCVQRCCNNNKKQTMEQGQGKFAPACMTSCDDVQKVQDLGCESKCGVRCCHDVKQVHDQVAWPSVLFAGATCAFLL